jgi:hypothetical protein
LSFRAVCPSGQISNTPCMSVATITAGIDVSALRGRHAAKPTEIHLPVGAWASSHQTVVGLPSLHVLERTVFERLTAADSDVNRRAASASPRSVPVMKAMR